MRKSKGSVVWVSSGAARGAYTAWGAYGSGKAAANHIIAHLAVEVPEITSIAMAPGRVDTDMQKLIRESGKEAMTEKDHASFISAHETGELVQPEQPAAVISGFVTRPEASLSGKYFKYVPLREHTNTNTTDETQLGWTGVGRVPPGRVVDTMGC